MTELFLSAFSGLLFLKMWARNYKLIYLVTLALILSVCVSGAKKGKPGHKGQDSNGDKKTPLNVDEESFDQDDSQERMQQEKVFPADVGTHKDEGPEYAQTSASPLHFTTMPNSSVFEHGNSNDTTVPNGDPTKRSITKIHNPLYPITDSSYSAYGILFLAFVVFAFGIVGNLAVMCIVWQNYFMRSAWNYLLASLAFWDFLVLCFCLPVVVFNELTNKRLLGDFSCRVVPYIEVRAF